MTLPISRSESYKTKKLWWARVKIIARSQLRRSPLVESQMTRLWRIARWLITKCKWKILAFAGVCSRQVDVDKVCMVSPQRIEYCSLREFSIYHFKGRVIGGNWDHLEKRFEDLDTYHALRQVCLDGKDWTETIFYQRIIGKLDRSEILWDCRNRTEFDQRCKDIETLYQNIKSEGYKSQREIMLSQKDYDPRNLEDEVTVCIGRNGDLLFSNSAHRLAIAKLLGIQKIPVNIAVRSPEWMRFRRELLAYAKELGGKLYQPVTHPDLDDIPVFHDSEDRFMMIKRKMSARSGHLLDIGANLGYFCHRFEDEGFDCYAIEDSAKHLYFLKKLKRAGSKRFKIIAESVLECHKIRDMHFEVVLALNIFHHFLKTEELYHKFVDLLENLQMDELFFEAHLPNERQMEKSYKNYAPDEFAEFVSKVSGLQNSKFIGKSPDGRSIYRLC